MNTPHLITASVAIAVAILSGVLEARVQRARIAKGDRRKLNHAHLTIARAMVLVPVAMWAGGGLTMAAALWLLYCAAMFAPVHRFTKNRCSGQSWAYMGPSIRGHRDSAYDRLWWALASYRVSDYYTHEGAKRSRFYVWHDALPFVLCSAFETCGGLLLGLALRYI